MKSINAKYNVYICNKLVKKHAAFDELITLSKKAVKECSPLIAVVLDGDKETSNYYISSTSFFSANLHYRGTDDDFDKLIVAGDAC